MSEAIRGLVILGLPLGLLSVLLGGAALLPFVGEDLVGPALALAAVAGLEAVLLVGLVLVARREDDDLEGLGLAGLVAVVAAFGVAVSGLAWVAHGTPGYDHWTFG